jgi:hypothetical protein
MRMSKLESRKVSNQSVVNAVEHSVECAVAAYALNIDTFYQHDGITKDDLAAMYKVAIVAIAAIADNYGVGRTARRDLFDGIRAAERKAHE